MTITLEMTPRERFVLLYGMTTAKARCLDLPGYEEVYAELMNKIAATPCGEKGCSYCDPDYRYEDYHADEL